MGLYERGSVEAFMKYGVIMYVDLGSAVEGSLQGSGSLGNHVVMVPFIFYQNIRICLFVNYYQYYIHFK